MSGPSLSRGSQGEAERVEGMKVAAHCSHTYWWRRVGSGLRGYREARRVGADHRGQERDGPCPSDRVASFCGPHVMLACVGWYAARVRRSKGECWAPAGASHGVGTIWGRRSWKGTPEVLSIRCGRGGGVRGTWGRPWTSRGFRGRCRAPASSAAGARGLGQVSDSAKSWPGPVPAGG